MGILVAPMIASAQRVIVFEEERIEGQIEKPEAF